MMCECDGYTCNRHDEENVVRLERDLAEAKEHVRQWERVGDKMDRGIKEIETELTEAKERERQLREALTKLDDVVAQENMARGAEMRLHHIIRAALTVPPAPIASVPPKEQG